MVDITEQLFLAVDTIVGERLKEINYDSTIVATIKSVQDAANYKYLCSNGSATFTAYSQDTSFKEGDSVYVTIPNNDYNQQKMIIGKYVAEDTTPFVFKRPFDNLIDVSNNLLVDITQDNMKLNINLNHSEEEGSKPQDWIQKKLISSNIFETSIAGFKRLGLKGQFQNFIAEHEPIAGVYGYELILISFKNANTSISAKQNFYTKLINAVEITDEIISEYNLIFGNSLSEDATLTTIIWEVLNSIVENEEEYTKTTLTFTNKDMFGNTYNFQTFTEQQKVFDISTLGPLVAYQLFFFEEGNFLDLHGDAIDPLPGEHCNLLTKKPYLCVGYDLSTVEDESAILYTLNNDTYSFSDGVSNDVNKKIINLRWMHKDENDNMNVYSSETDTFISGNEDDIDIRWYRYKLGQPSADEYSGVYWERIEKSTVNNNTQSDSEEIGLENESNNENVNNDTNISRATPETQDSGSDKEYYYYADVPSHIIYDVTGAPEFGQYTCRMYQKERHQILTNTTSTNPNASNNTFWNNLIDDFTYSFIPDVQRAEEKIKVIIIYKDKIIKSNILTFSNERDAANEATVNLISGLNLTPNDGRAGVYNIYGYNGKILNDQNNELKTLTASFKEIGGNISNSNKTLEAESITWTVPTSNTMLFFPGLSNSNNNCITWESDNGSVSAELEYQINNVYAREKTNNTIQCSIKKNGVIYNSSITFTFGTMNTSGADVNLQIVFADQENTALTFEYQYEQKQFCLAEENYSGDKYTILTSETYEEKPVFIKNTEAVSGIYKIIEVPEDANVVDGYLRIVSSQIIEIEARLTDKNNQLVDTNSYNLNFNWEFELNDNNYVIKSENNNNKCTFWLNNNLSTFNINNYFTIAKLTIKGWGDNTLIAYQPIPLRKKLTSLKVLNEQTEDISAALTWAVGNYENITNVTDIVAEIKSNNVLRPNGIYDNDNRFQCCKLTASDSTTNEIIWVQPIKIMQNKYFSEVINRWNGKSIELNQDEGYILTPAIAAGKKEDGLFSGVMMGDLGVGNISDIDRMFKQTGLYGFHKNAVSFAFKQDGTAFIGKSGRGRIYFDGSSGIIKSSAWNESQQIGMFLDLDDGILKMQQQNGFITATTLPDTSDGTYYYYTTQDWQIGNTETWLGTYNKNNKTITYDLNSLYKKRVYRQITDDLEKTEEWFAENADNIRWVKYVPYSPKDSSFSKYECKCKWIEYEKWEKTEEDFILEKKALYIKENKDNKIQFNPVGENDNYDKTLNYYIALSKEAEGKSPSEIQTLYNTENVRELMYGTQLVEYTKGEAINDNYDYYLKELKEIQYYQSPPENKYKYIEISQDETYQANKYYYFDNNDQEYKLDSSENRNQNVIYYNRIVKWNSIYDVNPISGVKNLYFIVVRAIKLLEKDQPFQENVQYYKRTDANERYITLSSSIDEYPLSIGTSEKEYERNFRVDWDGTCYITDGKFSGEIQADSGSIGGWAISNSALTSENNKIILQSNGQISIQGHLIINDDTKFGQFIGNDGNGPTEVIGIYNNSNNYNLVIENSCHASKSTIRIGSNGYPTEYDDNDRALPINHSGDHIILSGRCSIHGLTTSGSLFKIQDNGYITEEDENGNVVSRGTRELFNIHKVNDTGNDSDYYLNCNIPAGNQTGIYARFA